MLYTNVHTTVITKIVFRDQIVMFLWKSLQMAHVRDGGRNLVNETDSSNLLRIKIKSVHIMSSKT